MSAIATPWSRDQIAGRCKNFGVDNKHGMHLALTTSDSQAQFFALTIPPEQSLCVAAVRSTIGKVGPVAVKGVKVGLTRSVAKSLGLEAISLRPGCHCLPLTVARRDGTADNISSSIYASASIIAD